MTSSVAASGSLPTSWFASRCENASIGPATGTPAAWCPHRPRSCTVVSRPGLTRAARPASCGAPRDAARNERSRRAPPGWAASAPHRTSPAPVRPINCHPPGRRDRIHPGLFAGDADRPGRHALARHAMARRRDRRVDAAHVGEARARIRACRRGRSGRCAARSLRRRCTRRAPPPRRDPGPHSPPYRTRISIAARSGSCSMVPRFARFVFDRALERRQIGMQRIEMDADRAVPGHDVADPDTTRRSRMRVGERDHPLVDQRIDHRARTRPAASCRRHGRIRITAPRAACGECRRTRRWT